MNSTLQNPSLRNGSSGNDPIRAGLAGSRQAPLGSFGNDDNALHFKRLLSEYKQSEPVAAPPAPPSAEPPRSAGGSAPSSRPEEKQVQESKLQIRRQQARAADQAQNAKSETSKPADVTSRKLPEARLGESAVETQPEASETPNCPGEESQQSAMDASAQAMQLQSAYVTLANNGLRGKELALDTQIGDVEIRVSIDGATGAPEPLYASGRHEVASLAPENLSDAVPTVPEQAHASRFLENRLDTASTSTQVNSDVVISPARSQYSGTSNSTRQEVGSPSKGSTSAPSLAPLSSLSTGDLISEGQEVSAALENATRKTDGDGASIPLTRTLDAKLNDKLRSPTSFLISPPLSVNEALVATKTPRSADSLRLDRSLSVERGRPDPAATSPASGEIAAPTGSDGAAKLGVFGGSFAQDLRAALTGPQNTSFSGMAEAAAGLSNERFDGVSKGAQPGEPMVLSMSQGLYEPSFAPELGARLSMLAADGVQEAQLHLNPAELGPVAIQIVLEGQQAQISFHAEHAETRLVLEQGLPDLAAALRDAGLTLSGGGVFEQTRDPGGQEQQRNKSEASKAQITSALLDTSLTGPSANAVRPRNSEGMLDLYA